MIGPGMSDHDGLERLYLETIRGDRRGLGATLLRGALTAAELPYASAMRLRNALFDTGVKKTVDLRRPTVSIGNLTAGGTGKTPVVRWLAQRLLADGIPPAVLTRGYVKSVDGRTTHSDEADLLERAIGPIGGVVAVGGDRVASADRVLAEHPTVAAFILDDGFQHRRARRDVDLVLINAADPFGHGHVHPRGLLREPVDGLSRATAILLTHATRGAEMINETIATIRRHNGSAPIFRCDHVLAGLRTTSTPLSEAPDVATTTLATKKFFATAGIGHPDSLAAQLRAFGDAFVGHAWWDDHHPFTDAEIESLIATAELRGAAAIVTTEKDWSRLVWHPCARDARVPFLRLDVGLSFHADDEHRLYELIHSGLRSAL
jgi:tetraacyldisaccharide 4'-kinase